MTRRSRHLSPAVNARRRALARSPQVCAHATLRRDTRRIPPSLIDRHRPRLALGTPARHIDVLTPAMSTIQST